MTPDKMYPSSGSSAGAGVLVFDKFRIGIIHAALAAAKIGRGAICPGCFSSDGYGLLQDKVCAFCAYTGDGRDPAKDFLSIRVPETAG